VAVVRLVRERVPLAFRPIAAAHVLDDDDVAARGGFQAEALPAVLVVRRALEEHGKLPLSFRTVYIRTQRDAIAHRHLDAELGDDRSVLGAVARNARPDP